MPCQLALLGSSLPRGGETHCKRGIVAASCPCALTSPREPRVSLESARDERLVLRGGEAARGDAAEAKSAASCNREPCCREEQTHSEGRRDDSWWSRVPKVSPARPS